MKLASTLLLTSTLLFSHLISADTFTIENAHVRATPPHTQNSAAFMLINNHSDKSVKLVAASSDIAARVELHSHTMSDGMMKMRQVDEIVILANDKVELRPGSFHVMFLGLKSPLKAGENVIFKLYFDNGDEIIVDAPIKKITMQKKMKHNN
ncbi:copper chaperone PCu(A)C [Psychromonas hadalis]|uniref:copper chaperone PCu(A)C n=1 Tax=Psychromonas hadalis TaxID=211669 RepID=UPI0003B74DF4|nr:copper chaperone PCu(A)C [Psychromonas hadalis]